MYEKPVGNKFKLLVAAGDLFAKKGFEGTSVRQIAKKAGLNICSINYHFESKENLYIEVLNYIISETSTVQISSFNINQNEFQDQAKSINLLRKIIKDKLSSLVPSSNPKWFQQFIVRFIVDSQLVSDKIFQQVLKPEIDGLKKIFLTINPHLSVNKAEKLAHTIFAHSLFYLLTKPQFLSRNKSEYDEALIEEIIDHIVDLLSTALFPNKK